MIDGQNLETKVKKTKGLRFLRRLGETAAEFLILTNTFYAIHTYGSRCEGMNREQIEARSSLTLAYAEDGTLATRKDVWYWLMKPGRELGHTCYDRFGPLPAYKEKK